MVLYRENLVLDEDEKWRVREEVANRDFACGSCGWRDFEVGQALPLTFLFLDEPHDMYMVALTCKKPDCEKPHTGIKLKGPEFLNIQKRAAEANGS